MQLQPSFASRQFSDMLSEVGRTVIAGVAAGCAILLLFLLFSFIFSSFKCKHYRSAGSQEDACNYSDLQNVSYWKRRRHRNWPTKQSRVGQRLASPSSEEPPLEPALLTPTRWSPATSFSKRQNSSSPTAQTTPSSASSRRANAVDLESRKVTEEYHGLLGNTRSENLVGGHLPDLPAGNDFDDPSAAQSRGERRSYVPEWEMQTRPREGKASSEIDFDSFNKIIKDIDKTLKTLEHIKSPRSTYNGRNHIPARTDTVPSEFQLEDRCAGGDIPEVATQPSPGPLPFCFPPHVESCMQSTVIPRENISKDSRLGDDACPGGSRVPDHARTYSEDMPPPSKICRRAAPSQNGIQWPYGTVDTTSSCFAGSRPASPLRKGREIQPAGSSSIDNTTLHPSTSALLDSHVQAQSTRLNSCIARLSVSSMCESDSSTSCYESRASSPTLGNLNPRRLGGFFNPVPDPSDPLCFAFSKEGSRPGDREEENNTNRYSLHRFHDEPKPPDDSKAPSTELSNVHLRPLSSGDQKTRSLTRTSNASKPPLPIRSSLRRSARDPVSKDIEPTVSPDSEQSRTSTSHEPPAASLDQKGRSQADGAERYRDFSFDPISR